MSRGDSWRQLAPSSTALRAGRMKSSATAPAPPAVRLRSARLLVLFELVADVPNAPFSPALLAPAAVFFLPGFHLGDLFLRERPVELLLQRGERIGTRRAARAAHYDEA